MSTICLQVNKRGAKLKRAKELAARYFGSGPIVKPIRDHLGVAAMR